MKEEQWRQVETYFASFKELTAVERSERLAAIADELIRQQVTQ